jgi:hypothetical protein
MPAGPRSEFGEWRGFSYLQLPCVLALTPSHTRVTSLAFPSLTLACAQGTRGRGQGGGGKAPGCGDGVGIAILALLPAQPRPLRPLPQGTGSGRLPQMTREGSHFCLTLGSPLGFFLSWSLEEEARGLDQTHAKCKMLREGCEEVPGHSQAV